MTGRGVAEEILTLTEPSERARANAAGFRLLSLDPAWNSDDGGGGRGANCHYQTTSWQELFLAIRLSGLWKPRAAGAHVWMWQTSSSRKDGSAAALAQALGLRSTGFEQVWVKGRLRDDNELVPHIGLGQYGRMMHEYHHLYVVGADVAIPTSLRPRSVRVSPSRGKGLVHSAKPAVFYHDAWKAAQCDLPMFGDTPAVEFFARQPRKGWVVWGNEIDTDCRQSSAQPGRGNEA